jgi:hypothetical protein
LVEGPNGSGKSSLIGALLWALSGERPRDHANGDAHEAKPVTGAVNGTQRQVCAFSVHARNNRRQTSGASGPALCDGLGSVLLCGGHIGRCRMDDVTSKLTPEQALKIVERLRRKGGKLREAVVTEAMNVLTEIDLDGTADEVFVVLDSIDVQDCWDRSGGSRDGYTSPDEAAAEIIEEELQPFFEQVERYHELGMPRSGLLHGDNRRNLSPRARVQVGVQTMVRGHSRRMRWLSAGQVAETKSGKSQHQRDARIDNRCPEWAKWLKDK